MSDIPGPDEVRTILGASYRSAIDSSGEAIRGTLSEGVTEGVLSFARERERDAVAAELGKWPDTYIVIKGRSRGKEDREPWLLEWKIRPANAGARAETDDRMAPWA